MSNIYSVFEQDSGGGERQGESQGKSQGRSEALSDGVIATLRSHMGGGDVLYLETKHPGLNSKIEERAKIVVLVLDVSGSMSSHVKAQNEAAKHFCRNVQEAQIPPGLCYIIYFSSTVLSVIDVGSVEDIDAEIRRIENTHGYLCGTSFVPVMVELKKLCADERIIHVLFSTDGDSGDLQNCAGVEFPDGSMITPIFLCAETKSVYRQNEGGAKTTLKPLARRADVEIITNLEDLLGLIKGFVKYIHVDMSLPISINGSNDIDVLFISNGETAIGVCKINAETKLQILRAEEITVDGLQVIVEESDVPFPTANDLNFYSVSILNEYETIIQKAMKGDGDAITKLDVIIQELYDLAVKNKKDIEFYTEIRSMFTSIIEKSKSARGTRNYDAAFIAGQGQSLFDIFSQIRWHTQSAHGKSREQRRARRAVDVAEMRRMKYEKKVAKLLEKIKGIIKEMTNFESITITNDGNAVFYETTATKESLYACSTTTGDEITIEEITEIDGGYMIRMKCSVGERIEIMSQILDVPEDVITQSSKGWHNPVVVFSVPGENFNFDDVMRHLDGDGDNIEPEITMAMTNPASANGRVQWILDLISFIEMVKTGTRLCGKPMPGMIVVPYVSRNECQELLVKNMCSLLAMQMICGMNTVASTSGVLVYPAISHSILTSENLEPEKVSAALAMAPYAMELLKMSIRDNPHCEGEKANGIDIFKGYVNVYNSITYSTSSDADQLLRTSYTTLMMAVFYDLCHPMEESMFDKMVKACIFETARIGMKNLEPQLYQTSKLVELLNIDFEITTMMTNEEILDKIMQNKFTAHELAKLIDKGRPLKMKNHDIVVSYEHEAVKESLNFLNRLAWKEIKHPSAFIHRSQESWSSLLIFIQRCKKFLSGRQHVVAHADENGGWIRRKDAEIFCELDESVTLEKFLSPHEIIWMAFYLLKTEGNTSKIRESGKIIDIGTCINDNFLLQWVRENGVIKKKESDNRRDVYNSLIHDVITNKDERNPLICLTRLAKAIGAFNVDRHETLRKILTEIVRLMENHTTMNPETHLFEIMDCIPIENAKLEGIEDLLMTVLRFYCEKCKSLDLIMSSIPQSYFYNEAVVQFLTNDISIPMAEIINKRNPPGITPPVLGSKRFNKKLREWFMGVLQRLGEAFRRSIDFDKPITLSVGLHIDSRGNDLFTEEDMSNIFSGPYYASRIWFRRECNIGDTITDKFQELVAYRIDLTDGQQIQKQGCHWPQKWINYVREWRKNAIKDFPKDVEMNDVPRPSRQEMQLKDALKVALYS